TTSFKGTVAWQKAAEPSVALRGDANVDDFRATSPVAAAPRRGGLALVRDNATGPPLLNWKSLSLRGIDVALVPGAPARVTVAETALSDFFARVVLDEEGRLNLQQVARPEGAASAPSGAASAAQSAPAPAPAASAPAAVARGPAPIVNFGPIAL